MVEFEGSRLRFVDTVDLRRKERDTPESGKVSVVLARLYLEAAYIVLADD
jgi:hypothetical protein